MRLCESRQGAIGFRDFARQIDHAQNLHPGEAARAREHPLDVIAKPVRDDDDAPVRQRVSIAQAAHARSEGWFEVVKRSGHQDF